MEQTTTTQEETARKGFLYPLNIWALSFGGIIGWGAFVMPGTMFLPNAGPVGTIVAMLLGACIMLVIGKNFSVMAERFPDNGGIYAHTRNVLGPDHGFLAGWALGLAYLSLLWANATAFVLIARFLFGDLLQWGLHYTVAGYDVFLGEIVTIWVILIAFGLLTYYGGRLKRHLMTALGLILLFSVAAVFLGICFSDHHTVISPAFQPDTSPALQVFSMLMLAPWMFFGFEAITHASEDFSFDSKKLYPIVAAAVICGTLVYCLLTAISCMAVPDEYDNWTVYIADLSEHTGFGSMPVFQSVHQVLGISGVFILGLAMFSALSTSLLAFYRGTAHLFNAMAKDKLFPGNFLQEESGFPKKATLLIMIISLPIPLLGRTAISWLTDVTTISASLTYGYVSLCACRLAREEGSAPRVVLGIVGMVMSFFFFFCPIIPSFLLGSNLGEESYLLLSAWSLAGFVCYWYVFKHDRENRLGRSTSMCIIVLFLNFFATSIWLHKQTDNEIHMVEQGLEVSFDVISTNSLMQLGLATIILLLMADIFITLKKREQYMDLQIIEEREITHAKNSLLANISHDIRIPMQSLTNYVQLSLETCAACYVCTDDCSQKVPKAIGDHLDRIETLNQYLSSLINDMLLMERIDGSGIKMKEHTTDLRRTMQILSAIFSGWMQEKRLFFSVNMNQVDNAQVVCDEERLSRVIMNLIQNAYEHTPPGGGVLVTLIQQGPGYHQRRTEKGRLAFKTYADYEIHIQDTGQGISEEEISRIMAPFEGEKTAKELRERDRGLHIAKNVIELMGGELYVTSEPDRGTEFIVHLPLLLPSN